MSAWHKGTEFEPSLVPVLTEEKIPEHQWFDNIEPSRMEGMLK